jgi:hypothetical protein
VPGYLAIGEQTVKTHVSSLAKLGLQDRLQATIFASRHQADSYEAGTELPETLATAICRRVRTRPRQGLARTTADPVVGCPPSMACGPKSNLSAGAETCQRWTGRLPRGIRRCLKKMTER